MKKTFPLQVPGNADERVLEAIKFDIRKYLKRERRKTIPEGFDQWDFACKVGPDQETAVVTPVTDLFTGIEGVAKTGVPKVYIEVLAAPGKRFPAAPASVPPTTVEPRLSTELAPPSTEPPATAAI